MYSIGQLAKWANLSRSTLLYYDQLGLLSPACRANNGYRYYSEQNKQRLEQILLYRQAGLPLAGILQLLTETVLNNAADGLLPDVLQQQLDRLNQQIAGLRQQQRVVLQLLGVSNTHQIGNKAQWTALLQANGLTEQDMHRWHQEFESSMPEAHQQFLLSLGLDEADIQQIRRWSLEA